MSEEFPGFLVSENILSRRADVTNHNSCSYHFFLLLIHDNERNTSVNEQLCIVIWLDRKSEDKSSTWIMIFIKKIIFYTIILQIY